MEEVFRANGRVSGEPVAVKVLLQYHRDAATRFAWEVRVLADLSHLGIVRYGG